jgi:hypothetical protein
MSISLIRVIHAPKRGTGSAGTAFGSTRCMGAAFKGKRIQCVHLRVFRFKSSTSDSRGGISARIPDDADVQASSFACWPVCSRNPGRSSSPLFPAVRDRVAACRCGRLSERIRVASASSPRRFAAKQVQRVTPVRTPRRERRRNMEAA